VLGVLTAGPHFNRDTQPQPRQRTNSSSVKLSLPEIYSPTLVIAGCYVLPRRNEFYIVRIISN